MNRTDLFTPSLNQNLFRENLTTLATAKGLSVDHLGRLIARLSSQQLPSSQKRLIELKVIEFLIQGRSWLTSREDLEKVHSLAKLAGLLPVNDASLREHRELRQLVQMLSHAILSGKKIPNHDYASVCSTFIWHHMPDLAPFAKHIETFNRTIAELHRHQESDEQQGDAAADLGDGNEDTLSEDDTQQMFEAEEPAIFAEAMEPPAAPSPPVIEELFIPESPHNRTEEFVEVQPDGIPSSVVKQPSWSTMTKVALGALAALSGAAAWYYGREYFNPVLEAPINVPDASEVPCFPEDAPEFCPKEITDVVKSLLPQPAVTRMLSHEKATSTALVIVPPVKPVPEMDGNSSNIAVPPKLNTTDTADLDNALWVPVESQDSVSCVVKGALVDALAQNLGIVGGIVSMAALAGLAAYKAFQTLRSPATTATTVKPSPPKDDQTISTTPNSKDSPSHVVRRRRGASRSQNRRNPSIGGTPTHVLNTNNAGTLSTSSPTNTATTPQKDDKTPHTIVTGAPQTPILQAPSHTPQALTSSKTPPISSTPTSDPKKRKGTQRHRLSTTSQQSTTSPFRGNPFSPLFPESDKTTLRSLPAPSPIGAKTPNSDAFRRLSRSPITEKPITPVTSDSKNHSRLLPLSSPFRKSLSSPLKLSPGPTEDASSGAIMVNKFDSSFDSLASSEPDRVSFEMEDAETSKVVAYLQQIVEFLPVQKKQNSDEFDYRQDYEDKIKKINIIRDQTCKSMECISACIECYFNSINESITPTKTEEDFNHISETLSTQSYQNLNPNFIPFLIQALNDSKSRVQSECSDQLPIYFHFATLLLKDLETFVEKADFSIELFLKNMCAGPYFLTNKDVSAKLFIDGQQKELAKLKKQPLINAQALEGFSISLNIVAVARLKKDIDSFKKIFNEVNSGTLTPWKFALIERAYELNDVYRQFIRLYHDWYEFNDTHQIPSTDKEGEENSKADPYTHLARERSQEKIDSIKDFEKVIKTTETVGAIRKELDWESTLTSLVKNPAFSYLNQGSSLAGMYFSAISESHDKDISRAGDLEGCKEELDTQRNDLKLKTGQHLSNVMREYTLDELLAVIAVSGKKEEILQNLEYRIQSHHNLESLPMTFDKNLFNAVCQACADSFYQNCSNTNGLPSIISKLRGDIRLAVLEMITNFVTPFNRGYVDSPKLSTSLQEILNDNKHFNDLVAKWITTITTLKNTPSTIEKKLTSEIHKLFEGVREQMSALQKIADSLSQGIKIGGDRTKRKEKTTLETDNQTFNLAEANARKSVENLEKLLEDALTKGIRELKFPHQSGDYKPAISEILGNVRRFIETINTNCTEKNYFILRSIETEVTTIIQKITSGVRPLVESEIKHHLIIQQKEKLSSLFGNPCNTQTSEINQFVENCLSHDNRLKDVALRTCRQEVQKGVLTPFQTKEELWKEVFSRTSSNELIDTVKDVLFHQLTVESTSVALPSTPLKRVNPREINNAIIESAKKRQDYQMSVGILKDPNDSK